MRTSSILVAHGMVWGSRPVRPQCWDQSNFYQLRSDTDLHWSTNTKLVASTGLAPWFTSHLSHFLPLFDSELCSLILAYTSVHRNHWDSFLHSPFLASFSASFPSPSISLALAFPLHGTVLLPCWAQSSLHCWRQVAKDTSTERHSLNVMRWERWAERGERGNSLYGHWAARQQR